MPIQPNPLVKYVYDQQEIVPQPTGTLKPEEEYWQNCVAPVAASNLVLLPAQLDREEIPAGSLLTQVEPGAGDGSWSSASFLALPRGIQLRYFFDPEQPQLAQVFQPEEDLWVSGVAPAISEPTILQFSDDWAINPQFDEDFWTNAVAPLVSTNIAAPQWLFETGESVPPPIFAGQSDEDFWQNAVAPLPTTFSLLQQSSFDQNESPSLFGQYDEDFWNNPVKPVQAVLWQALPINWDDQPTIQPVVPGDDNEFWQNMVAPVPPGMYLVYPYYFTNDDILPPVVVTVGQGGTVVVHGFQSHMTGFNAF